MLGNVRYFRAHSKSIKKIGCFVKQISVALIGGLQPTLPELLFSAPSAFSAVNHSHSIVAGGLLEMS